MILIMYEMCFNGIKIAVLSKKRTKNLPTAGGFAPRPPKSCGWAVAYIGFLKGGGGGGGARKFENNEDQKKISPLRISPFFCPKLGEEQKKSLYSILIQFLAQNYVKIKHKKKKRSLPRFCPFVSSNFLPKLQRRLPFRNFAYYSVLIILPWRSKGGGGHGTLAPPKYASAAGGYAPQTPVCDTFEIHWLSQHVSKMEYLLFSTLV